MKVLSIMAGVAVAVLLSHAVGVGARTDAQKHARTQNSPSEDLGVRATNLSRTVYVRWPSAQQTCEWNHYQDPERAPEHLGTASKHGEFFIEVVWAIEDAEPTVRCYRETP